MEKDVFRLTFIGADHEVTGSLHLLEAGGLKILIDCGMEQGQNHYENAVLPVRYEEVDYLILTHAHIDHAGMIPYAFVEGFAGRILCTRASLDLDGIMLLDSAHIQESEAEYKNRKGKRAGKEEVKPVYTVADAESCLKLFDAIPYGETKALNDQVSVRFFDAGHILGSASAEVTVREGTVTRTIVFSGDIGNTGKPLIRDPETPAAADYVVMESTYGGRLHEKERDHVRDLAKILQETLDRGGNVLIPAFAVGRTQELLYLIRQIKAEGLVKGHDGFPVYVDSPLAVRATHVFHDNMTDCYDEETAALVNKGINPIDFPGLTLSISVEDSKQINFDPEPKVIISASGMCDAGRIRHHLKHNLWRPECTVVFAGYQATGTLGRMLQDGAEQVKLFGEMIAVEARIATMGGISSHADEDGLMKWIGAFGLGIKRVFLVHGEDEAMEALSGRIERELPLKVECPFSGSVFDFDRDEWCIKAEPVVIVKKNTEGQEDTGRIDIGRKEDDRKEACRKEEGRKEEGRKEEGRKEEGRKKADRTDTGVKETGRKEAERKAAGRNEAERALAELERMAADCGNWDNRSAADFAEELKALMEKYRRGV